MPEIRGGATVMDDVFNDGEDGEGSEDGTGEGNDVLLGLALIGVDG